MRALVLSRSRRHRLRTSDPHRRRRSGARALAVTLTGGLALAVLPALPAHAALTSPANGATVSGLVAINESGATNGCLAVVHNPAVSSRLEVTRASDGAVVHTASRGGTGALSSTWNSLGQPRGTYIVRSWTRNAVSSGFLGSGCTLQAEGLRSTHTVNLQNGSAVSVGVPATVTSGEALTVTVQTRHNSTGASGPLGGRSVVITVPGVGVADVTTDEAGQGSTTFDLPDLSAGPLAVSAVALEDALYTASAEAGASTAVTKRRTALLYRGATRALPGETATLEAQLVDATTGSDRFGDPIADEPVSLSFDGSAEEQLTTASGRAVRTVQVSGAPRTLPVTADYAGDGVYLPSQDAITFYVGDDASVPAEQAHSTVGGLTSLVGGLLGGLLQPVTGGGASTPLPLSIGDIVGLLTGGNTPLDGLAAMVDAGLVQLLDASGLRALLTELNSGLVETVRTAGDPVDDVLDGLLRSVNTGTPLDDLIAATGFRWRSIYVQEDGTRVAREFGARIGVPEPLDVTGDGNPDVVANLGLVTEAVALGISNAGNLIAIDTAGRLDTVVPRLEVARMTNDQRELPISLQAIVELPGQSDSFRFGYDAREGDAPRGFRSDITLGDAGAVLQVSATGAGPFNVTGALDPDASVAGPEQRFGVSFSEAPRKARVGVELGSGSSQNIAATLTTDRPTDISVTLDDDSAGSEVFTAGVDLAQVDGAVSFELAGDGDEGLAARVATQRPLPSLEVSGQQLVDGRVATDVFLGLTDVPSVLDFSLGADGQGALTASAPVTVFEAGFGQNRAVQRLDDPAYLNLLSDSAADSQSIALRLPGFEGMSLDLGEETGAVGIGLTIEPTPLRAVVDQDGLQLDARVLDAPRQLDLSLADSGAVSVRGSAPIDLITIEGRDADGIFDGSTDLDLRIEEVPEVLEVGIVGDQVRFGTGGQPIGLLELNAHGGTPLPMPEGDGLTVRTSPAGTNIAGRITGLREIEAGLSGAPSVLLDTVAGQVFELGLQDVDEAGAVQSDVSATIDHLVPDLRLGLVDDGAGALTLQYRASEPTNSLSFDFDGLSGSIAGPLPASLDICFAGDESCLPGLGIPNPELGTISFDASEHTTLNLVDPSSGINVQNLRVRLLEVTGSLDVENGGDVYLNTTDFSGECGFDGCRYPILGGQIVLDDGGDIRLVFRPGNGFFAVDAITNLEPRRTLGVVTGVRGTGGTGIVNCVGDTLLDVTIRNIPILGSLTLNLRSEICNVTRTPRVPPAPEPEPEPEVAPAPSGEAAAPEAAPASPAEQPSDVPADSSDDPSDAAEDGAEGDPASAAESPAPTAAEGVPAGAS